MASEESPGTSRSLQHGRDREGENEHSASSSSGATSSGSAETMSSGSIIPDPIATDEPMNVDSINEPVNDPSFDEGIDAVNENEEGLMPMDEHFVPRFEEYPDAVGYPGFVEVNHGPGYVNDGESSDDGDPNENVQNDHDHVYEEDWENPESVGTHSTGTLSNVSFSLSLRTAWVMDRLLRSDTVAWILRKLRRRRRLRLLSPVDNERDNESDDEDNPLVEFDPELPARHAYLGEAMEELEGRIVLEEESVLEIPIVVMNFHLIPGQTLPMTVFHAVFQNAIRRCILNERIFGVVNSGNDAALWEGRTIVSRHALGTVAEIYEFQEENDLPNDQFMVPPPPIMGLNFALKAKGRQRFNVLEVRRQADGNLMAKVKIRPELQLSSPMTQVVSNDRIRFQFPMLSASSMIPVAPEEQSMSIEEELQTEASTSAAAGAGGDASSHNMPPKNPLEDLLSEINRRKPLNKYYSALTPWPAFVYDNYDARILVEKIHRKLLNELRGLTQSHTSVPLDPTELSFWLAQNLTMDDSIRLQILQMDSCIQRLRFELSLLQNVSQVISCRRCMTTIGDQADIFAMSSEGPQGTYVNPNGHIHETLTVHEVREIITRGFPSTVASWFQGYAWTIAECRRCRQHLGWKFKATGRLKPKKFWGLCRKSVTFKYDFSSDERRNLLDERSSSTSSSFSTALTAPPLPPSQEY